MGIQASDVGRWSAADLKIFKSFNAAGAAFDPAQALPELVAMTFAPNGPLAFEQCVAVLREALFDALLPEGSAATAAQVASRFAADARTAARRLWITGIGFGAEVSSVH